MCDTGKCLNCDTFKIEEFNVSMAYRYVWKCLKCLFEHSVMHRWIPNCLYRFDNRPKTRSISNITHMHKLLELHPASAPYAIWSEMKRDNLHGAKKPSAASATTSWPIPGKKTATFSSYDEKQTRHAFSSCSRRAKTRLSQVRQRQYTTQTPWTEPNPASKACRRRMQSWHSPSQCANAPARSHWRNVSWKSRLFACRVFRRRLRTKASTMDHLVVQSDWVEVN